MEALESVIGEVSKAQFARRAIMEAVWALVVDSEYQTDVREDWRKARGL